MFQLADFVSECLAARGASNHLSALATVVHAAIGDAAAVRGAFAAYPDEEALIFRDELLTIVHVRVSPNVVFPPHDHQMDGLVGVYEGREVHRQYVNSGDRLVMVRETGLAAGEVARCGLRDIHSVGNGSGQRSAALHVYCGDLIATRRQIWNPLTFEAAAYRDETYFAWSLPFDSGRPFTPPALCRAHAYGGRPSAAARP